MRKSGLFGAILLVAAACSSSDGTAPGTSTSVFVSASRSQILVNATVRAKATVKDQNGNTLKGETITWSSLTPAIASVDPTTGIVKGLAPGVATIQASDGSVSGTTTITVSAPLASCLSGPVVLNLAVGQSAVVNAASSQDCIKIAATSSPSQYLVITSNSDSLTDQIATFTLKTDTGEVVPRTSLLTNTFGLNATRLLHRRRRILEHCKRRLRASCVFRRGVN
jgi:Bacterial surface proteins containing Ig-like domains